MSSYNTGAISGDTGGAVAQATGVHLTIPSGVLVDDQLIILTGFFTWSDVVVSDISCVAASGHTWTKVGGIRQSAVNGSLIYTAATFMRKATSGDASDTLTIKLVGTPSATDQEWWEAAITAYTGFPGGVDAHTERNGVGDEISPIAYPDITTNSDGCWVVYLGPGGSNSSGDVSGPVTGTTQRESHNNSGLIACICDTAASVGNAGTSVTGKSQPVMNGGGGWEVTQAIALSPVPPGVTGTGSIAMHKMGLSATGRAPVRGTGSIAMHKMGIHIQGRLPGVGSVAMHKMGISATGHAPLQGTGSIRMHKMGLFGAGFSGMSVVFNSTDGNGVDSYTVTSQYNGPGTQPMRILQPDAPAAGYPPVFLYVLTVSAGLPDGFGEGLDTIRIGGWHNAYNMTLIEPGFGIDPWDADNPTDPNLRYETFLVRLANWVENNLGSSGLEQHVLIGFSKSGIGGQGVILNNPTVFDKCISWDFPADFDDITTRFTGNADLNYGTNTQFQGRYELDDTNLTRWEVPFQSTDRLWIGGEALYGGEVVNYDARLTSHGMLHTYPTPVSRSHAWDSGWVGPALADVMQQRVSGVGSIRMVKMSLASSGVAKTTGTGSIRMHKMGIHSTPPVHTHASSIFVFTDV